MAEEVVAADEKVQETYLRRLFEALGYKGVAVLFAVPAALAVTAVFRGVNPTLPALAVAAVFAAATAADTRLDPTSSLDTVGAAFVAVSAGYAAILYAGMTFVWVHGVAAAGLVLGSVGYEYLSKGGDGGIGEIHAEDVDPLHLDIVGFVVAEVLVVYSVLHSTAWGDFADSPVFVALAYLLFVSTVAAFAGYAVITREIVVSRTSDEVHAALVSILKDLMEVSDGELRRKLALNARRVAECLDGLRMPTDVEDRYGRVPVVLSTRKPDLNRMDLTTEQVVEIADRAGFTGYVTLEDVVFVFRNGSLSKRYEGGGYAADVVGAEDLVDDASFYSLEYPTVMNLLEITPDEGGIADPLAAVEEIQDKEVDESAKVGQSLSIGGEEVEVDEMFSITEELVDESPKATGGEKKLDVGGDEIDVDALMDRADDVIEELSE